MASKKTVIVTGASQGIGAAVVQAFLDRSYNVVATSRSVSKACRWRRKSVPFWWAEGASGVVTAWLAAGTRM